VIALQKTLYNTLSDEEFVKLLNSQDWLQLGAQAADGRFHFSQGYLSRILLHNEP